MKTLLAAIATVLFAASVGADDVYHGLARGNAELNDAHPPTDRSVGVQPHVGDNTAVIYGLTDDVGNPDHFQWQPTDRAAKRPGGKAPNFYGGFCGSSEIPC